MVAPPRGSGVIYTFDRFELDTRLYELRREGRPVPVEPQVFDVLNLLVECRDQVVSKDQILERVWADRFISESTLVSRVTAARKAIDDDAKAQRLIKTVHGRGYRFVGEVEERGGDAAAAPEPVELAAEGDRRQPPSILGREDELRLLGEALEAAAAGDRRIVFVTGEAGLGKTTLVEAFVDQVRAGGEAWITSGQCLEHSGAGEAYMPVLEAVGRLCGRAEGGELVSLLVRRAPSWMAQMPWLLTDEQLDALKRRLGTVRNERMVREMGEALERLTARRPLLLVLEDLHWSDPSTVDLIAWIAARAEPCRLLLLATYRPEDVAAGGHPLAAVHQRLRLRGQCDDLTLPMLSRQAVRQYLERRMPNGPLPAGLATLVRRRTDGNPLFMVNLIETWIADGLLVQGPEGGWALQAPVEELGRRVPDSLRQLVELRLADLAPERRAALESASVAGMTFAAAAAATGCGGDVEEVERVLSRLAGEGRFLRFDGTAEWPDGTLSDRFEFIHSLYRDVIYDRVPAGRRSRLHRRIGRRVEEAYGSRAAERAAELALHYTRGRAPRRAVVFLRAAAERALDRGAYRESIGHFEAALGLLDGLPDKDHESDRLELDLRLVYAPTLAAIRGWGDAAVERAFRRALELCRALGEEGELFPILYGLAGMHELRGEFDACQRVLERHNPHPDWPQLEFHEMMACSVFHQGAYGEALSHVESALEGYDREASAPYTRAYGESAVVRAHVWAALALWFQGYPDRAVDRLRQGLELAEGPDLIYSLSNARSQFACLRQLRREPELALRAARNTIDVAKRHGFAYREAMGKMIAGWVLATHRGEHQAGIEALREGLEFSDQVSAALDRPYFLALLAEAYLAAADADSALATLQTALEMIEPRRYFYEPELHRLLGRVRLRKGSHRDPDAAEEHLRQALAVARRHGSRSLELRAAIDLAGRWIEVGRAEEARETLAEPLAWFGREVESADLRDAEELLARR